MTTGGSKGGVGQRYDLPDLESPQPEDWQSVSRRAFERDRAELLSMHFRHWVAYQGDKRIALHDNKTALYQACMAQGFKPGDFIVWSIDDTAVDQVDLPADV